MTGVNTFAEQTGREENGGQHQTVGVYDPLQVAGGGVQIGGQGRQRQVEHREVQADHGSGQGEGGELVEGDGAASGFDVVQHVLDAINSAGHIRANVYLDSELGFVEEIDAPGIADYRMQLDAALHGASVSRLPHEQIIHKLDQSAQLFRILVVKTGMTISYTAVFFELDCGYWNAGAEKRLREAMLASGLK